MSRLARASLMILSLGLLALVVVDFSLTWNERATDICRKDTRRAASGYSVRWDWAEFAYVCDYSTPGKDSRRVGVIDAFHGEEKQRHRPGR